MVFILNITSLFSMTQEEKQLLLKDLCARLPYGVYVHIRYNTGEPCYGKLTSQDIQWFIDSKIEIVKPYLRPMSSMTEEEQRMLDSMCDGVEMVSRLSGLKMFNKAFDWLNANHFDYRGLIPMGLALEAKEGMYPIY